jgi:SRSO17 transposase
MHDIGLALPSGSLYAGVERPGSPPDSFAAAQPAGPPNSSPGVGRIDPEIWLIIRRNLDDPTEVKFYFSNAPADTPVIEFVRISGMRWPIEIIFEEAKGEVGFDHYEMRSWLGWHHHMLLVALAHHFLVRLRVRFQHLSPALTVLGLTQLVGGWGSLGGLRPPKLPQIHLKCVTRTFIKFDYY